MAPCWLLAACVLASALAMAESMSSGGAGELSVSVLKISRSRPSHANQAFVGSFRPAIQLPSNVYTYYVRCVCVCVRARVCVCCVCVCVCEV